MIKRYKFFTKKLSSTVILLILLALGVFAVVFNRFYINSSAKLYNSGDPTQETGRSGGGVSVVCCTTRQIKQGYKCVKVGRINDCVAPSNCVTGQTKCVGNDLFTCNARVYAYTKTCTLGCVNNNCCPDGGANKCDDPRYGQVGVPTTYCSIDGSQKIYSCKLNPALGGCPAYYVKNLERDCNNESRYCMRKDNVGVIGCYRPSVDIDCVEGSLTCEGNKLQICSRVDCPDCVISGSYHLRKNLLVDCNNFKVSSGKVSRCTLNNGGGCDPSNY